MGRVQNPGVDQLSDHARFGMGHQQFFDTKLFMLPTRESRMILRVLSLASPTSNCAAFFFPTFWLGLLQWDHSISQKC